MPSRYHSRSNLAHPAPCKTKPTNSPPAKRARRRTCWPCRNWERSWCELNEQQLRAMQLPEALLDAVLEAKPLTKHEARRRQMQFIGRLMRDIDAAPIRERLENGWDKAASTRRSCTPWNVGAMSFSPAIRRSRAFCRRIPGADSQKLRTLIRNARREQSAALAAEELPRTVPHTARNHWQRAGSRYLKCRPPTMNYAKRARNIVDRPGIHQRPRLGRGVQGRRHPGAGGLVRRGHRGTRVAHAKAPDPGRASR